MKVRKDCPFAKLTDKQKDFVLDMAEGMPIDRLADRVEVEFNLETSTSGMRRYLIKLRREKMLEEAKDSEEELIELAAMGKDSKARDAALEMTRQKLCDLAVAENDPGKLTEVMRVLSEDKVKEHELAMKDRAMALAEENAKIGWRKLELQQAQTALRLLPAIRAILMDGEIPAEERVARARECLGAGSARLLPESASPSRYF